MPGWGKGRFQLFADVENFTNLLNNKWGQIREYSFPYNFAPVRVACLSAPVPTGTAPGGAAVTNTSQTCAQYRYSNFTGASDTVYPRQSLYAIRVGLRFSF
ncbi:MAG: hypothetical protein U5M50_15715 [Sphingobium sp.]|nr:hypothetical protein [Sphingobium sp.]